MTETGAFCESGGDIVNRRLQGILIRKRRQAADWSQETLCKGICAVSYLSKIEQGKTEGSSEVLLLLLRRLGIHWREEPEFCRETSNWFEEWYDRLFSGESIRELGPALTQRQEEYGNSPFFLDWLLLSWLTEGSPPEDVRDFVPAMDERQYQLYLRLTERFQELLRRSDRSYFLLEAGKRFFWQGEYGDAIVYLQRGMDQAYRERSLNLIMQCCIFLGNCFGNLNQLKQAREHYADAIRMARSLGRKDLMEVITYNLATTELQVGLTEDALYHLLSTPWNEAMYFHKLAICYERLGKREKVQQALEQAQTAPLKALPGTPDQAREVFSQMCRLVQLRLDDSNYLKNPEYGRILQAYFQNTKKQLPMSFVRFHAGWLDEWYVANRQYQQAHEFIRYIFLNNKI